MYLNFFGLNKEPFGITPDPAFLFLSPSHKEALAVVIYGVQQRKGFIVITGEVGVGKTTILRSYLAQTDKDLLKTVYLFNTNVTFPALLKTICHELAVPGVVDDPVETLRQLHQFLIREYSRGCNIVLVIDEAQNIPLETLENIRMLSNLETDTEKLIQIIFSGQPEFDQLLDRHELRQLKQRIAVRTTIAPLTAQESADYIKYRLIKAGDKGGVLFTSSALKRILRHAQGIPRALNILCDNALITSFGHQKKPVPSDIVREILRDFKSAKEPIGRAWLISAAAMLVIAGVLGLILFAGRPEPASIAETSPQNQLIEPVQSSTNKMVLSASVSEEPLVPEKEIVPDIRVDKVDDTLTRLVEDAEYITEENLENAPVKIAMEKIVLSGSVTEEPLVPENRTVPVVRVVKAGDTLSRLVEDVYDEKSQRLIALVKQHNSGITNIDRITVGTKIIFPTIGNEAGKEDYPLAASSKSLMNKRRSHE